MTYEVPITGIIVVQADSAKAAQALARGSDNWKVFETDTPTPND